MTDQLDAPIAAGLNKVDLLDVGHGFVNVDAGARSAAGGVEAFARGEAGVKFSTRGSLFGFGEASKSMGSDLAWQTGIGLRWTF